MSADKSDILQGTLDLMVLKTLDAMGPLHGYGIARRIEQISEEALQINQGTIYASLVRLMQKRWISGAWGISDNNRKAKFYSITKAGRKQLNAEAENWERISAVIGRVLRLARPRIIKCLRGLERSPLALARGSRRVKSIGILPTSSIPISICSPTKISAGACSQKKPAALLASNSAESRN